MQIFKTYFKIIKKHMGQISIYIVIFLALSIMFSVTSPTKDIEDFTQSKARIAFINEDENSVLIGGFKEYLGNYSVYVPIQNDTGKLQDALFFRDVEYILRIPGGFTKAVMEGKPVQIEKTAISGSTGSIYTDIIVNKYFNTARLYLNSYKNITQEDLVKQIAKDLKIETSVQMKKTEENRTNTSNIKFYYNYLAYVIIAILVLGVSTIMMVFNDKNLKRRNLCSPVKNTTINLQIIFGNMIFGIVCWGLIVLCSFILYSDQILTKSILYFCINSFVFMLVALSISFFVGIFVKSGNSQSAAANVLSLGLSFISGVFVPQELLGQNVLAIARFTPTYWYVAANNAICNLTNYSLDNLSPIYKSMLVQLGFAIAILSVALVISKRKQIEGN